MSDNKLVRSQSERMIMGVAGGIAEYFNTDPTFVRLGLALFALATGFMPGVVLYIILAIVMPEENYVGAVDGFDPEEIVIKDVD